LSELNLYKIVFI